jgi:type III secretion protein L
MLILTTHKTLIPGSKIIPADEYAGIVNAKAIVERAKDQAKAIVTKASHQSQTTLAAADKVYEDEKQRGHAEGFEAGSQKVVETLFSMVEKGIEYVEKLEGTLVYVVRQSLAKILGEVEDNQKIVAIVRQALKMVKDSKGVKLRLHPDNVGVVRTRLDEVLATLPTSPTIDCSPDSTMTKDQCILETEFGIVDASLDIQLQSIVNTLEKTLR